MLSCIRHLLRDIHSSYMSWGADIGIINKIFLVSHVHYVIHGLVSSWVSHFDFLLLGTWSWWFGLGLGLWLKRKALHTCRFWRLLQCKLLQLPCKKDWLFAVSGWRFINTLCRVRRASCNAFYGAAAPLGWTWFQRIPRPCIINTAAFLDINFSESCIIINFRNITLVILHLGNPFRFLNKHRQLVSTFFEFVDSESRFWMGRNGRKFAFA